MLHDDFHAVTDLEQASPAVLRAAIEEGGLIEHDGMDGRC